MSKNRLEAFSDGVIAVAITLLALDLSVPGPGHGSLLTLIGDRWPEFAAYAVSFFLIGIIWVNHHARFNLIVYVDRTLLFLNLVLLLFVVLIPFATATVAAYLTSGSTDSHVAMALYAVVLEGMALSFGAIFEWSLGEGAARCRCPGVNAGGASPNLHRRAGLRDRLRGGVHQRARRTGDHRADGRVLRVRAAAARDAGRQGAFRVWSALVRGCPRGLSNVTDMAQATLSNRPHAAECHQTENLGAGS